MFTTPFTYMKSAAVAPPPPPVEQLFTSSGTWSCCTGAVCVEVLVIGGGGGGNSGGVDSRVATCATFVNIGGAGGGGAGIALATLSGGQVPSSACVIIGAGGAGGQANSINCNTGYVGSDGGNSCFGTCIVACGGISKNSGSSNGGGYNRAGLGGVNGCPGLGGTAVINTGSGIACTGGEGGQMFGSNICQAALLGGSAENVTGTFRPRGGAAGGSQSCCASGLGGTAIAGTVCCGVCIGASGCGGGSEKAAGGNGESYGAGGGGGHAANSVTAGKGGNGAPGVVKVIQYFA